VKDADGTQGSLKIRPLRMLMVATRALEGLLMKSSMPPCYYPAQQDLCVCVSVSPKNIEEHFKQDS